MKTIIEPFRIKVVEPLYVTTPEQRDAILRVAHFNVFNIPARDVLIDLLTDSGTGAMSSMQWAGIMQGDESYAGSESFFHFKSRLEEMTGFEHILPTHQGRASERILFELVGGPGKVIPNNNHFDTTRANIEHSGAEAVDLVIEEANDPTNRHPFKGSAYLIKRREPGQRQRTVRAIVREMFDLADGAIISAKKDGLVNIGGVLLLKDEELAQRADALLILTEGFVTYGGLAGRDLEAMAQGFEEVLHEDYLAYRIRSVEYLGERLLDIGYRIVEPPGGHAVYIDAGHLCPHIPPAQFPGQALVCALYRHAGIRACMRSGAVS